MRGKKTIPFTWLLLDSNFASMTDMVKDIVPTKKRNSWSISSSYNLRMLQLMLQRHTLVYYTEDKVHIPSSLHSNHCHFNFLNNILITVL